MVPNVQRTPESMQGRMSRCLCLTRCHRDRTAKYMSFIKIYPFDLSNPASRPIFSGLDFKFERQSVAFTASNVRFFHILFSFFTICLYLHPTHERCRKRTTNCCAQLHEFTRICLIDPGYGACAAEVTCPFLTCNFEKTALFHTSTAEVISVKMWAFFTCWCFHDRIIR